MARRAPRAALALPLLLCLLAARASAQEPRPVEPATLDRPESPVVIPGVRLDRLLGAPGAELRAFAWQDGSFRTIPFQLDERTPEERYVLDKGDERRSDTDDGRLDINDEVVFMARDVGPRIDPTTIHLGQSALEEILVTDPRSGGKGWVYLLRFPSAPPPPSSRSYVSLDMRDGELAGWEGDRVKVVGPPVDDDLFYFQELHFARPGGGYGPDVLDRAKISLEASYLFLDIRRRADEVRAELLGYKEGPVRVVADYLLETYLIWGHWIHSTRRCRLKIYGNRLEIETELVLPVNLEPNRKSALRFSLDFSPAAEPLRIWTALDRKPFHATGHRRLAALRFDHKLPPWVVATCPQGTILARLQLGSDLRRKTNRLFLADDPTPDPPEELPGSLGNTGFSIDLTQKPAGTYSFHLTLQFGPPIEPGQEERLLRVDDAPLMATVTR